MSEVQEGFDRTKRELLSAGRNLWLAGLGAVAEAGEEGRGLFDRLVERGRPLDARQRQAIGKTIETIGDRTQGAVRELGRLVQDTAEYEAKAVVQRLGVPARDDVTQLASRIDTLEKKIDELEARHVIAAEIPLESATGASTPERRPRQRKSRGDV